MRTYKQLRYRLALAYADRCIYWAARLGKYALLRKLDLMGYPQRDRVGTLLDREIAALAPSVEAYLTHQRTEIEILRARLARRYDPGAALNEATERAIKAKQIAFDANVHPQTGVPLPEVHGRVSERMREGETLRVLAEELKAKYGDKPEVEDFWTREAARQRVERAANPEPAQPLTKAQLAALEMQKHSARKAIENS